MKERLNIISKVIEGMNIVLERIIPGMTIEVRDYGDETLKDGCLATRIELMSKRNSKIIPLKYESDGIKKIISILDLLIIAYNTQSITVAIDELDSGVFEYLLGEVLKIISEQGRGQLIFTSHSTNLLDLDLLRRDQIWFTEKGEQTAATDLFSLYDFSVRKDMKVEKGYLIGRFGAIPFIKGGL